MTAARPGAVLTVDQQLVFRAALQEQRRFRIDQLADLDGVAGEEITDQLRAAARFALAQIEAALERLEAGSYGVCTGCTGDIGIERLEILPMAAMCVRCERDRQR